MNNQDINDLNSLLKQLAYSNNGIIIDHTDRNIMLATQLEKEEYAICGGDNEKICLRLTVKGRDFYNKGGYKAEEPLKVETIQCERDYNEALRTSKTSKRLSIVALIISGFAVGVSIFFGFFKQ